MADESSHNKTEQPTPRRLEKAADDGQVPSSADFSSGILLLTASLFFILAGPWLGAQLLEQLKQNIRSIFRPEFTTEDASRVIISSFVEVLNILWPLALMTISAAMLLSFAVSGFRITMKPLAPDLSRTSPKKGIKKIFSSRAVVRGLMAFAKVSVMTAIAYWIIRVSMGSIEQTSGLDPGVIISIGWTITMQITIAIAAAITAVGAFDLIFQKWKHLQDLKMSKQEIKDELKETDGDPMLRARIRQLQREVSNRKMLRDIPSATVVVTNPTHLAVALRYEQPRDEAPIVVAKGADILAQQIRIIAKENDVPILERKPLARALYQGVEVGDEIPLELYQAVAETLAYVMEQRTILS